MAKRAARFRVGSSGSGKHTETYGTGEHLSDDVRSDTGPRIGPGSLCKRVQPEYARSAQGDDGRAKGGPKGRPYDEE